MCIEQIEKDEEEAKKKAKMVLNTTYGISSRKANKTQEIDFIIKYIRSLKNIVNRTTTYDITSRLQDVIRLLNGLKEEQSDSSTNIDRLFIINKDELNGILNDFDGVLWDIQHIQYYSPANKIVEISEKIYDIRRKIADIKE
jgi:hypothetical protein